METKKTMATFAVLMVALAVAGFVYAHWSDVLYINGEVKMGSLTFGFTNITGCGEGKMLLNGTVIPEPKPWVCNTTCWLEINETDVHTNKTVYKKMWVIIDNAYPEYLAWCNFTLDNAGTIPLDVTMYCVLVNTTDGLTYNWNDSKIIGYKDLDLSGNWTVGEPVVINIWFYPFFFGQIDPCHETPTSILIHIKEDAEECHTYKFEISIKASQWDP